MASVRIVHPPSPAHSVVLLELAANAAVACSAHLHRVRKSSRVHNSAVRQLEWAPDNVCATACRHAALYMLSTPCPQAPCARILHTGSGWCAGPQQQVLLCCSTTTTASPAGAGSQSLTEIFHLASWIWPTVSPVSSGTLMVIFLPEMVKLALPGDPPKLSLSSVTIE